MKEYVGKSVEKLYKVAMRALGVEGGDRQRIEKALKREEMEVKLLWWKGTEAAVCLLVDSVYLLLQSRQVSQPQSKKPE